MAPEFAETSTVQSLQLLRVEPAAERLGISPWTLRRMAYSGEVASHKVKGRLCFEVLEINRVITESRRPRAVERQEASAAA